MRQLQYRIVDTAGWPMLGRSDPAAPTGGWITDPVVIDSGELVFSSRDMSWQHDGTTAVADRTYRHQTPNPGGVTDFGNYFHTNLRMVADVAEFTFFDDEVDVDAGDGEVLTFKLLSEATEYTSPAGWERFVMDKIGGTQYRITDRDGSEYYFEPGTDPANLISTRNRYGEGEDYYYDASDLLTQITVSPSTDIFIDRDAAGAITAIRDYAGRTASYAYDGSGNLTKVEDACSSCSGISAAGYLYDGSNRITEIKDGTDTTVRTIAYDGSNRVSYYVDGTGNTFNFEYGTPELAIDPEDNTSAYTFDGEGNMISKTLAYGTSIAATYIYEYDAGRRITQATLPNGAVSINTYDDRGNVLLSTVTADSVTITTYEATVDVEAYSVPLTKEQLGQGMTTFQYASPGKLTKATRSTLANSRTYAYNGQGLKTQEVDATGRQIDYTYDSNGFLISKTVDSTFLTTYTVDDLGRVISQTTPEGHLSTTEFDEGGKVSKTTTAEGIVTTYEYNGAGRHTARKIMDGETVLFASTTTYDDAGRVLSLTRQNSTITTYAYDLAGRRTKTTDPEGGVIERVYDALGRVVTTKTGDGTSMIDKRIVVYDNMNNVVTSTDAEGNQTIYEYDGFGRLITTTDPAGHYTTYDYDDAGRQTAVKRFKSGGTILTHSTTEYDTLGRVTKTRVKANPGGADGDNDALTEMVYDDEDRLLTRTIHVDASTVNETTYAYDGAGRQTQVTDPDSLATTYAYDSDSRRTKVTDANGNDTTYTYDADGRQTKVTNPLGDYTVTTFDDRGLRTDVSNYASGGTRLAQTVYEYDDNSRQTLSRRKVAPGGVGTEDDTKDFVVKSYYDDAGTLTKRTGASGNDTTYAYDAYGRQTLVTLPDGSYTTSSYDLNGALTSQVRYEIVSGTTRSFRTDHAIDPLGRVTQTTNQGPDGTFGNADDLDVTYVYDGVGRRVTTTDEAGRNVITEYDALGRKTRVTEDAGGIGRVTDFGYDRAGRLVDLIAYTDGTTGAETTSYAYNGRGLQTIVTYEETGDVTMGYDAAGNMTQRTDEASVAVDYAYDDANRLTQRKKSSSSNDIETYVYDGLGRLITAEKGTSGNGDAVSASAFTYDSLSRVNEECQSIAEGSGQSVAYAYDKAGNRTQMIYHGEATTANYAYDSRDRATSIDNGSQRLADYTWIGSAIAQRDTTCDYPGTTKPKLKTAFERDGILRVTKVDNEHLTLDQATSGYNDLGEFDYTYDAASNPTAASQANDMGDLKASRTYTYDSLNRLTQANYTDAQDWTGGLGFTSLKSTYVYDDLGNRSSHKYRVPLVGPSTAITYEHDKANRMTLIDGQTQGYDLAGNVTLAFSADRGTSYVYKYDHHNRLTAIWDGPTGTSSRKAAFTYDALGRRIEHVNDVLGSTARYYYDGVNEIVETDGSGNRSRYYVHGISYVDERLMMFNEDDDRPYYYTLDRMYNVRFLVDRAGGLVERYMYDAYGRPHIRESCGRGDMDNETTLTSTDDTRFTAAKNATIWDPRADMDDDGDVDANDQTAYDTKVTEWPPPTFGAPNVEWAFSRVGNPFMFQGRPHFALDTTEDATEGVLMLNDHRARMNDPVTGRWITRDPLEYDRRKLEPHARRGSSFLRPRTTANLRRRKGQWLYVSINSRPMSLVDPLGLACCLPEDFVGPLTCKQAVECHPLARQIAGNGFSVDAIPGETCSDGGWVTIPLLSDPPRGCMIQACCLDPNFAQTLCHELLHCYQLKQNMFDTTLLEDRICAEMQACTQNTSSPDQQFDCAVVSCSNFQPRQTCEDAAWELVFEGRDDCFVPPVGFGPCQGAAGG